MPQPKRVKQLKRQQAPSDSEDHRHVGDYVLRLYIAGTTSRSSRAVMNVKEICEKSLQSMYDLEVIDIYQQPLLARTQQIIAAPTLVKELPPPLRKFVGDMSDTSKILVGLGLKPKPSD